MPSALNASFSQDFGKTPTDMFDIAAANNQFKNAQPADIIRYALTYAKRPLISTSFGAHSAALLHLLTQIRPDITVLWVDSGYNTAATYRFADKLTIALKLNLHSYVPHISAAHLNARYRGIPDADT
ncbi:MAG TPA: phosphoadenosine phosphosulfate reductase family protein, partial [Pseudomonadales bacterium]|nr:phosphoadenosine phosphosulfate reductase family protein [Pseudomonadales bacterium]